MPAQYSSDTAVLQNSLIKIAELPCYLLLDLTSYTYSSIASSIKDKPLRCKHYGAGSGKEPSYKELKHCRPCSEGGGPQ